MDINKFAKQNDLVRKFEKAIEAVDRGNGWGVFAGLDKGETTVKVIFDGAFVRFERPKKAKRIKKASREKTDLKPKVEPNAQPSGSTDNE